MRIAFVLPEIGPGGAERVATLLAGAWRQAGHSVTLLTLDDGSVPPFHAVPDGVVHRPLALQRTSRGLADAVAANVDRVTRLRGALLDIAPDVVVSFIDQANVLTLLAAWRTGIPVVVSERVAPNCQPLGRAWRTLRRMTYPWAARLVAPTKAMAVMMRRWSPRSVEVIPNPISVPSGVPAERGKNVLAVGRLVPQKGFDRLIDAFFALPEDWTLTIAGEGPERGRLEALAAGSPRIRLPGVIADLGPLYATCGMFVLSSRYEGYPNALAEAMSAGCPCVAVDCPTGPAEMIASDVNGLLVSPSDLASGMCRLAGDDDLRDRLGKARPPEAESSRGIAEAWLDLFRLVI